MKLRILALAVALVSGTVLSGVSRADTATFNGAVTPPSQVYSEAGISFTGRTASYDVYFQFDNTWFPDAMSGYNDQCCLPQPIQITQSGGGLFTLSSLDIVYDYGTHETSFVGSNGASYHVTGPGSI